MSVETSHLADRCGPGLAQITLFLIWYAVTDPVVVWFLQCWIMCGPHLINHIWATKGTWAECSGVQCMVWAGAGPDMRDQHCLVKKTMMYQTNGVMYKGRVLIIIIYLVFFHTGCKQFLVWLDCSLEEHICLLLHILSSETDITADNYQLFNRKPLQKQPDCLFNKQVY